MASPMNQREDSFEAVLMVVDHDTRNVLAISGDARRLPVMTMSRRTRAAKALQEWLEREYGITAVMLEFLHTPIDGIALILAEALSAVTIRNAAWVAFDDIPDDCLKDADRSAIRKRLCLEAPKKAGDIGWISEAIAWAEASVSDRLVHHGAIAQWNAGCSFSLLRLPMQKHTYWLKATGAPHLHELSANRFAFELDPESVAPIVAWRDDWNAWLTEQQGIPMNAMPCEPVTVLHLLERAVRSVATLQVESAGRCDAILACGGFDQTLPRLLRDGEQLFDFLIEACSHSTANAAQEASCLTTTRSLFELACTRLVRWNMPATLVHGDLNLGNLVFLKDRCLVLDWAEFYLGHPVSSLQHLLLLNPITDRAVRAMIESRLTGIYRKAMHPVIEERALDEAIASMPLLAAVAALYGRGDWLDGDRSRKVRLARGVAPHVIAGAEQFTSHLKGLRT